MTDDQVTRRIRFRGTPGQLAGLLRILAEHDVTATLDHPPPGVPGDPDRPYTGWARTLGEMAQRFPYIPGPDCTCGYEDLDHVADDGNGWRPCFLCLKCETYTPA